MFSTKSYLERKTGPYGIGRLSYLQSLVNEYQNTEDNEAKVQIMGNLANFAYDPINYEYMRSLNVLDLFLDGIEEMEEKLVEFAMGGLCNACNDPENRQHIIHNGGIRLIISCLSQPNVDTVLSAITTLMYLITHETKNEIVCLPVVECLLRLSQSKNKQLKNLASIFVEDYCDQDIVKEALQVQQEHSQLATS